MFSYNTKKYISQNLQQTHYYISFISVSPGTRFSNLPDPCRQMGPRRGPTSPRPRQEEVDPGVAVGQGALHPEGGAAQLKARRPSQSLHRRSPRLHRS